MEGKTLIDRKYKFEKDFSCPSIDKQKLISARQKTNLSIRKNKIEEILMKKRFTSLIRQATECTFKEEQFQHLLINLNELKEHIPPYLDQEMDIYDDKISKIKEFIINYLNEANSNTFIYLKYAIYKLRIITSNWKNVDDETLIIDKQLLDFITKILKSSSDVQVQYEILYILINLTYESDKYKDEIIDNPTLTTLFSLLSSNERGIIYHTTWLFANIFDCQENCSLILHILENFIAKLIELVNIFSNLYINNEICKNITWLVYRILRNDESLVNSFSPIFNHLIDFLDYEVSRIQIIKETPDLLMKSNSKNTGDYGVLNNVLLIFNRIVQSSEDPELFKFLGNSSLIKNLITLQKEDLVEENYYYLLFRIIGGISSSISSITEIVLNFGYLESLELYLLKCIIENNLEKNKEILKELAFSVSNIAADYQPHTDRLILKSRVPEYLLKISETLKAAKFLKEITYIFYNALDFGGNLTKETIISNSKILKHICYCIKNPNLEYTKENLDLLRLILEESKTLEFQDFKYYAILKEHLEAEDLMIALENLHLKSSDDIASTAEYILLDHWNLDEITKFTKEALKR